MRRPPDTATARREGEEHRAAAAAASAAGQAASTARAQAEDQADRARAAQAGAERGLVPAVLLAAARLAGVGVGWLTPPARDLHASPATAEAGRGC